MLQIFKLTKENEILNLKNQKNHQKENNRKGHFDIAKLHWIFLDVSGYLYKIENKGDINQKRVEIQRFNKNL